MGSQEVKCRDRSEEDEGEEDEDIASDHGDQAVEALHTARSGEEREAATDLVCEESGQGRDQGVGQTEGGEDEASVRGREVVGLQEKRLQGGRVPLPGYTGADQREDWDGEAGREENLTPGHVSVSLSVLLEVRHISEAEHAHQRHQHWESSRGSEGQRKASQVI